MDEVQLREFDLRYPGDWIAGSNRAWAGDTQHMLRLAENQFQCAVVAHAMFEPVTLKNFDKQSKYRGSLNQIYATAFVFSLDSISKLLTVLLEEFQPPDAVKRLIAQYNRQFSDVKHIRDSAAHFEDRGRGLDKSGKPLGTKVIVMGAFNGRRVDFTGGDGKCYGLDISESTLLAAHGILQSIIESYSWE